MTRTWIAAIELTWLDRRMALHAYAPMSMADLLHARVALAARGMHVRAWVGGKLLGVR